MAPVIREELIIVGGSYAACKIAGAARDNGYEGNIRILTDERELPYDRPPLSKAFLLATDDKGSLPLKGENFYRDGNIDVIFGAYVTAIDTHANNVTLAHGSMMKFDKLALAVGARNRRLNIPGSDFLGVHYLRSIEEARTLKNEAENAAKIVILGGGFIGLEVASAFAQQGKQVTVLDAHFADGERRFHVMVSTRFV